MSRTRKIPRPRTNGPLSVVLASILLFIASVGWSQIRVRTDLVQVPVSVRSSDGEAVTRLTKDDFIIREDGQLQTITAFDNDPLPLSAVIVVDDGVSDIELRRVTSKLFALAAGITPEDEISIFRYDRFVEKLSDFSSDPKVIQKSFDAINQIAENRPEEQQEIIKGGPGWLRSILGIFPDGSKTTSKNRVLHNAIFEAAQALHDRPAERRRIIFIISNGQASGKENVHTLKENTALLLQNDIQVFGVSTDYASFGSFGALSSYARATGGDVFGGATDQTMEHAFNEITEEARHQYVLGYVSTNTKGSPGVFRMIEVTMRQPDQRVTYRQGYISYTPQ